jgi:hypothetical protein
MVPGRESVKAAKMSLLTGHVMHSGTAAFAPN